MHDCSEVAVMLSDYLDRDLPPDACTRIEAHMNTCPECTDAAESLRRTVELCRKFRSENRPGPLPADKHEQMRSAFEKVLAGMRDTK